MAIQATHNFRHKQDNFANRQESALLCHRSEVSFNKVNCGTMDQAAVALGKKDKLMLLNCSNLECDYITPNWKDYTLLIINSNKPRNLLETAYNQRRSEAGLCLKIVQDEFAVNNLCDIPRDKSEAALNLIGKKVTNCYKSVPAIYSVKLKEWMIRF